MATGDGTVKRQKEAGQTLTLVAFAMVSLLAAAGLAVDVGFMRYERRLMQSAADAAAIAAATDLNLGLTGGGQAQSDAFAVAQANGFTDGVNNTTVTYQNPGGINYGTPAQVVIQQVFPSFFMKVVGINSSTIAASAVATLGTSEGCIYALQVGGGGLVLNGGINAPNCGILDNGPLTGAGNITAPSVGVYQGFGGYGGVSSSPIGAIVQPASDPLAYINQDPPTPAGTCIPDPMLNGTSGLAMDGIVTLNEATYCSITINSGAMVTFNPGLYILTQAPGLQITGTGTATGNQVAFYALNGAAFTFSGIGNVMLSAQTGGVSTLPPGILFYQDQGDTSAGDVSEDGGGTPTGNVHLQGTLYFPNAALTIAGSVANTNTLIVASSVTVSGTTPLDSDLTSVPGGTPLQNVSLVE